MTLLLDSFWEEVSHAYITDLLGEDREWVRTGK